MKGGQRKGREQEVASWVKLVLPMWKGMDYQMGYQMDFQMDSFLPRLQVLQTSMNLYSHRHQTKITDHQAGALVSSLCLVPPSFSPPPPFLPFPLSFSMAPPVTLHPV